MDNGYEAELKEPESEWWQEIRVLLKYKQHTRPIRRQWAEILSKMSESTHRVRAAVIWRRMGKWKFDLTVDDILNYTPKKNKAAHSPSEGQLRNQRRDGSFSRSDTGTLEKNGEWEGVIKRYQIGVTQENFIAADKRPIGMKTQTSRQVGSLKSCGTAPT